MAEFTQIIKDWERMCKSHTDCYACPLREKLFNCEVMPCLSQDAAEFAREITAWAAEHPEPVYPTWYDYLYSIGVFYKKHTASGDVTEIHWGNVMTPISADIAKKLDIKPKEK